jgi:hypothetical protein
VLVEISRLKCEDFGETYLNKYDLKMLTRFTWLMIETNGGIVLIIMNHTQNELS